MQQFRVPAQISGTGGRPRRRGAAAAPGDFAAQVVRAIASGSRVHMHAVGETAPQLHLRLGPAVVLDRQRSLTGRSPRQRSWSTMVTAPTPTMQCKHAV